MKNKVIRSKISLAAAMFIFGSIGIFRRFIPLPSGMLAMIRGISGALFLLIYTLASGKGLSKPAIKKNLAKLLISGGLIGFNWILLFEAYNFTTVATATLCYYMAPVFVMIASPFLLKETLNSKKILSIILAIAGMILVSGILKTGLGGAGDFKGIICGLGAAVLYASVILLNQKITDIPAFDKTIIQLAAAGTAIIPYVLLRESAAPDMLTVGVILMMAVVGIVHTGLAYALYFGSMDDLTAQTVAIYGYIDPIVAVLASALVLGEPMSLAEALGAVLIIGATLMSSIGENDQEIKKGKTKMRVRRTSVIGDMLREDPDIAEVLQNCGMHCITCPSAAHETLEEACEVHDIDVEDVLEAIQEYFEAYEQNM